MKRISRLLILFGAAGLAAGASLPPPPVDTLTPVDGLGEPPGNVCGDEAAPSRIAAIAPLDERTYDADDEPVMMVAVDPTLHFSELEVLATLIDPLGFVHGTFQVPITSPSADAGLVEVKLPIWQLYRGKPALLHLRLHAVDNGHVVASNHVDAIALLPVDGLVAVLDSDNALPVWPTERTGSPAGIAVVEDGVAPAPVYATEDDEEVTP
ncbi:MAG: hypothetical protein HYS27_01015 [Deltaproteobacteria bacterium]|nr:hypothetical protein [Deltaproteobacteria bacterium]